MPHAHRHTITQVCVKTWLHVLSLAAGAPLSPCGGREKGAGFPTKTPRTDSSSLHKQATQDALGWGCARCRPPCANQKKMPPRWEELGLTEPVLGKGDASVTFRKGILPLGRILAGKDTWLGKKGKVCISVSTCPWSEQPARACAVAWGEGSAAPPWLQQVEQGPPAMRSTPSSPETARHTAPPQKKLNFIQLTYKRQNLKKIQF